MPGVVDMLKPLAGSATNDNAEGEVLKSLIDPKLFEMTTEITDPHAMTVMELIGVQLSTEQLPKSSALVALYATIDKKNMIPNKRKRAEEIIRGVGASRKAKRTFTERLVGKNVDVDD